MIMAPPRTGRIRCILPPCSRPTIKSSFPPNTALIRRNDLDIIDPQQSTGGPHDPDHLRHVVSEMTEALRDGPDNAAALFRRGNAYSNLGEYESTKEDMTRVIHLEPENSMAHNNRGVAYLCTGDPESAVRDFSRALALDPQYRDAHHNRGLAYSELERIEEAIADMTRAIDLDPEFRSAYRHRSILYAMAGIHDASYRDYIKGRDLGG